MSELLLNVVSDPHTDATSESASAEGPKFLDEVIVTRKKKPKVEEVIDTEADGTFLTEGG